MSHISYKHAGGGAGAPWVIGNGVRARKAEFSRKMDIVVSEIRRLLEEMSPM